MSPQAYKCSSRNTENKESIRNVYFSGSGYIFIFRAEHQKQGRTLKFYLGGCQHALDRLNFSGPTERIWAVRTHWEL